MKQMNYILSASAIIFGAILIDCFSLIVVGTVFFMCGIVLGMITYLD